MIKFNMNNYVWFEPTELGEKVYNDYFTRLGFEEPYNKLKIVQLQNIASRKIDSIVDLYNLLRSKEYY